MDQVDNIRKPDKVKKERLIYDYNYDCYYGYNNNTNSIDTNSIDTNSIDINSTGTNSSDDEENVVLSNNINISQENIEFSLNDEESNPEICKENPGGNYDDEVINKILEESKIQAEKELFEIALREIEENNEKEKMKRKNVLGKFSARIKNICNVTPEIVFLKNILENYISSNQDIFYVNEEEYKKFIQIMDEFYVIPESLNKQTAFDKSVFDLLFSIIYLEKNKVY